MIKLQISRKLGSGNWNVQDFLTCINEEILARENYEYLKRDSFEDPKATSTFFTSSNVKCCVFCKKDNHYSNQCKIITDVKLRCEFLKKNNLCFNCFKLGHSKKNCKNNIKCYHCKGNHNTTLCYRRQNRKSHREIPLNYHKEIIKVAKLTIEMKFSMRMERAKKVYLKVT